MKTVFKITLIQKLLFTCQDQDFFFIKQSGIQSIYQWIRTSIHYKLFYMKQDVINYQNQSIMEVGKEMPGVVPEKTPDEVPEKSPKEMPNVHPTITPNELPEDKRQKIGYRDTNTLAQKD